VASFTSIIAIVSAKIQKNLITQTAITLFFVTLQRNYELRQ